MNAGWRIAAGELRIPYGTGLAAHRMILVIDPAGRVVRQINGLASWLDRGQERWRHKPIGYLKSDRLRGYDTQRHPRTWLPVHGVGLFGQDAASAIDRGDVRVLAGDLTERDLDQRLEPGLAALEAINALSPGPEGGSGLPYPFLGFGPNSNSFYATILAAMGFAPPPFATRVWLAPGAAAVLLPGERLAALASGVDRRRAEA